MDVQKYVIRGDGNRERGNRISTSYHHVEKNFLCNTRDRTCLRPADPRCGFKDPGYPARYHPLFAKDTARRGGIRTDAGPEPRRAMRENPRSE